MFSLQIVEMEVFVILLSSLLAFMPHTFNIALGKPWVPIFPDIHLVKLTKLSAQSCENYFLIGYNFSRDCDYLLLSFQDIMDHFSSFNREQNTVVKSCLIYSPSSIKTFHSNQTSTLLSCGQNASKYEYI